MCPLLMDILELSSRFHLMVGLGEPAARHVSVTLAPSRTITSLELSESSIVGGTETNYFLKLLEHLEKLEPESGKWWVAQMLPDDITGLPT